MAALKSGSILEPWIYNETDAKDHYTLIEVSHCGVCYSDIHMINNDWNVSKYPFVGGHEIIGRIKSIGDSVNNLNVGDVVGVGWQRSACLHCLDCLSGNENLCSVAYQATIVGHHGGFASHFLTDSRFVFKIPSGLDLLSSAPLLCGGITVYSALISAGMTSGNEIGVIGLGGLGHMAVLFAKALGNSVTVFTRSEDKADLAINKLGASHVIYSNEPLPKKLDNPPKIIINTVDHSLEWDKYIRLLDTDGTLTFVGNPGKITIPVELLLNKRKRIMASPIGGRARITEMLHIANKYNIRPIVEKFSLANVNEAIKKVKNNNIRFRAVLVS